MNHLKSSIFSVFLLLISSVFIVSCEEDKQPLTTDFKKDFVSENVILVVVDGPRYSETFGDPAHRYVPYLADSLAPKGVFNDKFYNLGLTKTVPGHTAIMTGVYQDLENNGDQFPNYPSILQLYLEHTKADPNDAWIVTSKKKLGVLGDCSHMDFRNRYNPRSDAEGRNDLITYSKAIEVMKDHRPKMMMVHFRGPDKYGHSEDWENYLGSIRETDSLLFQLWKVIEADPHYSGKTTLIMTNDHGRHLDDVQNGFKSHGCKCIGCTHINFFAIGPDIKEGAIISRKREQIDILPTIAHLMGFEVHHGEGESMTELFK